MPEQKWWSVDTIQPNGRRDTFSVLAVSREDARETAEQTIVHDGKNEKIVRIYR